MILAVDVHYDEVTDTACAAGVAFEAWTDAAPHATYATKIAGIAPYEPGNFYKRELPCLLALITAHDLQPRCVVVDGFVHLDVAGAKGLGAHLFEALAGRVPVLGVAKSGFARSDPRFEVRRGTSARPLYVTAAGVALDDAKAWIVAMHGEHRMPTLLTAVDHLCRGLA